MNKITDKKVKIALDEAYKEAGHNAYFGNGFELGVRFAEEQFEMLNLHSVLGQRELLKAFLIQLQEVADDDATITNEEAFIDGFLKAFNCDGECSNENSGLHLQNVRCCVLDDSDFVVEEEMVLKQYKCRNCEILHVITDDKYCYNCGTRIKWHCT